LWQVGCQQRVGIFTLRDVRRGEELTYDYNFEGFWQPGAALQCKCGSENCRGTLGGKKKTKEEIEKEKAAAAKKKGASKKKASGANKKKQATSEPKKRKDGNKPRKPAQKKRKVESSGPSTGTVGAAAANAAEHGEAKMSDDETQSDADSQGSSDSETEERASE
jgi:hypothetical protein